jgi:co-chaperonin GroES (HSP10)
MKAEPLADRVLIHPLDGERQIGDVILPDSAKEDFRAGIVTAIGPDVQTLKVKDQVLFGPYAGQPIQVAGTDFLVMRVGEIVLRLVD